MSSLSDKNIAINALKIKLAADQEQCSKLAILYSQKYSPLHFSQIKNTQDIKATTEARDKLIAEMNALLEDMANIRKQLAELENKKPSDPDYMELRDTNS